MAESGLPMGRDATPLWLTKVQQYAGGAVWLCYSTAPRKAGQQAQKRPGMTHIFVTCAAVLLKDLQNARFCVIKPKRKARNPVLRCPARQQITSISGVGPLRGRRFFVQKEPLCLYP